MEDLENTKEEGKKLLLEIIDAINEDKTQNNSKNTEKICWKWKHHITSKYENKNRDENRGSKWW